MGSTRRLILASASPQRRELLARVCGAFDVIPCPYREPCVPPQGVSHRRWALSLAHLKARGVAELHRGRWVLGADTIVACAGRLLGKAADAAEALAMLELQSRQVSEVITGVCLLRCGDAPRRRTGVAVTRVWMRDDAAARAAYVTSGDWVGKAGAYGIQTVGDRLVERIEGSFSNVVGLPLELVVRMLGELGLGGGAVRAEVAASEGAGDAADR